MPRTFPKKATGVLISGFVWGKFIAFLGVSRRWEMGVKKHKIPFYKKFAFASISFYKQIQNRFISVFFNTLLGVSRRGSAKTPQMQYRRHKLDPGPFWASDPPTHGR
jgi:hypothetical protein